MKRVNKILMATVAILLCLVLITTSVVSGVFARFVVKNTVTSTVTFAKFGAKVSVNLDGLTKDSDGNTIAGITVTENVNANSNTITVTGLKIGPGDMVPNAMRFNLSEGGAKPAVNIRMRIKIELGYNELYFGAAESATLNFPDSVLSQNSTWGTDTWYFMPIGYTLGHNSTKDSGYVRVLEPWYNTSKSSGWISPSTVSNNLCRGIVSNITSPTAEKGINEVTIGTFTAGQEPKITIKDLSTTPTSTFDFGYIWPLDENADRDVVGTYIANRIPDDATFTLKVTVTLERV